MFCGPHVAIAGALATRGGGGGGREDAAVGSVLGRVGLRIQGDEAWSRRQSWTAAPSSPCGYVRAGSRQETATLEMYEMLISAGEKGLELVISQYPSPSPRHKAMVVSALQVFHSVR